MHIHKQNSLTMMLVAGALAAVPVQSVFAQNTPTQGATQAAPTTASRNTNTPTSTPAVTPTASANESLYIEFKGVSLYDALKTVFDAADNPSHVINEAAKTTYIAPIVFNNVAWDAAMQQLVNRNGFRVTRNAQGTYIIEPRPVGRAGRAGQRGQRNRQNMNRGGNVANAGGGNFGGGGNLGVGGTNGGNVPGRIPVGTGFGSLGRR